MLPALTSTYFHLMEKNRLEAFSDGVLAIIITIMVLEMKETARRGIRRAELIVPGLL